MRRRGLEETPGSKGFGGQGTPRGEVPVAPPRASLGARRAGMDLWTCCGEDWGGRLDYDQHLARSHGGARAAQGAEGGSGQGTEPRRSGFPEGRL